MTEQEMTIKNFLRRILIKKEFIDSEDKAYIEHKKLKNKIDPVILLQWTIQIILEEFNVMSNNPPLCDSILKELVDV